MQSWCSKNTKHWLQCEVEAEICHGVSVCRCLPQWQTMTEIHGASTAAKLKASFSPFFLPKTMGLALCLVCQLWGIIYFGPFGPFSLQSKRAWQVIRGLVFQQRWTDHTPEDTMRTIKWKRWGHSTVTEAATGRVLFHHSLPSSNRDTRDSLFALLSGFWGQFTTLRLAALPLFGHIYAHIPLNLPRWVGSCRWQTE